MTSEIKISVCLCTYKRPQGLIDVLSGIACQKNLPGEIEVIIVDNDSAGSAREAVDNFSIQSKNLQIHYHIEPEQNIALARNRSVANAKGEWIAFIDDDEIPEAEWLSELVATAEKFDADGVFGPVFPILPNGTPLWIKKGRFFEKKSAQRTGDNVSAGGTRTSNTLMRAVDLKQRKTLFDPRLGLTGGSDYHLFADMLDHGSKFVWSEKAIVHEEIPKERANLKWLLKRYVRNGQIYADRMIDLNRKRAYFELTIRAFIGFGLAIVIAPVMLPFGIHRSIQFLKKGANGLGFLMALTEYRYEPYRTA